MKHIQYNAIEYMREYMLSCLLVVVLGFGYVGVKVSGFPIEELRDKALAAFIMVAQSLSYKDSDDHSNELIKMEGRRRKSDWKDIPEQFAWNHRMLEEGGAIAPKHPTWRVKPSKNRKKLNTGRMLEVETTLRWATYGITAACIWVSVNYTESMLNNLGAEVIRWIAEH